MKKLLALLPLALCAFIGIEGDNPNELTFWYWAAEPAVMIPAVECSLARIRAATCLPVDVSFDAHVFIRQRPAADMAPFMGKSVAGNTRIQLSTAALYPCDVLTHEIAQHVLRNRADHAPGGDITYLSAPLVAEVCARHVCGCQVPETASFHQ